MLVHGPMNHISLSIPSLFYKHTHYSGLYSIVQFYQRDLVIVFLLAYGQDVLGRQKLNVGAWPHEPYISFNTIPFL